MEALVNSIFDPITTLSGAFTIGDAAIAVNAPTSPDVWPVSQEFRVRLDNEYLIVTAATSNATSLPVTTAGAEFSAAANHGSGTPLYPVWTKASITRFMQKYGLPGDTPPATPNALDDEFSGSAISGGWSWRNQGTSTYTADFTNEIAKLSIPSSATANTRIIEQNVPGADFTVIAKLYPALPVTADSYTAGLVLVNSTSGRLVTLHYRSGNTFNAIRVGRWNSTTSFNATVITSAGGGASSSPMPPILAPIFFKIVTTASKATLNFYISGDGYSWIPLGTETVATFLTATGGTMDKMGIFMDAESSSFTPIEMTLYHFRVS